MELVVEEKAVNDFLALAGGDRTESDRFVRQHYADVYRWFLWLTNCPHRAADLTQDTFAAFWESLKRDAPETSPRTWLYAIGRNRWRKDCRDRHDDLTGGDDLLDEQVAATRSPHDAVEQREFAAALEAEVARLPADFREVFVLRIWQDFDYDDIAQVQGITRDLARWRYFRARQILRTRLKAFGLQED